MRELLDLLIAERIVLLNSPSGAGKSSLIQAGLVPALEEELFRVLPVVRVNLEPPASVRDIKNFNRYAFSVMLSIEESYPPEQQTPVEELASTSQTLADMSDRFRQTVGRFTIGAVGSDEPAPVGSPRRARSAAKREAKKPDEAKS